MPPATVKFSSMADPEFPPEKFPMATVNGGAKSVRTGIIFSSTARSGIKPVKEFAVRTIQSPVSIGLIPTNNPNHHENIS